ncbi:hypothetical protein R1flu_024382 [Riccia fluitans]|uniref:Uncharacterized protein n=1 Tax=Riccia fluitans TaxID=41844 RepID=A0ABD1XUR8_9MARC
MLRYPQYDAMIPSIQYVKQFSYYDRGHTTNHVSFGLAWLSSEQKEQKKSESGECQVFNGVHLNAEVHPVEKPNIDGKLKWILTISNPRKSCASAFRIQRIPCRAKSSLVCPAGKKEALKEPRTVTFPVREPYSHNSNSSILGSGCTTHISFVRRRR